MERRLRVDHVAVHNFGSYDTLSFRPEGLTLLYGKTGSGKSTIADTVPWCLFAVTAKNGNIDEVRSWTNLDEPTIVVVKLILKDSTSLAIHRVRSKHFNDLCLYEEGSHTPIRGKDIKDTQKIINARLGIDPQLYLAAAYFHEFSATGNFFSASAKDRRALFDQLTNLELPIKIAERTTNARKELKKTIQETTTAIDRAKGRTEQLQQSIKDCETRSDHWRTEQMDKAVRARTERETFLKDKQRKLDKLESQLKVVESSLVDDQYYVDAIKELLQASENLYKQVCPTCGGKKSHNEYRDLNDEISRFRQERVANKGNINLYDSLCNQIIQLTDSAFPDAVPQDNPYKDQLVELQGQLWLDTKKLDNWNKSLTDLTSKFDSLGHLYDLSFDLRGALLTKVVREIQDSTNSYLEKFFDAEIRVDFTVTNSDDLDITIHKSGYECAYSQLSKGQRQLLKLCFAVSVMYASANKAGIHFDNLFFDEALDGLDSELKVKAFRLLEELSTKHTSVLVIDHSTELQELFTNKMHVTLEGDRSQVSFDNE